MSGAKPDRRMYRRCLSCAAVLPAAGLKRVAGSKPDYGAGQKTSCPMCGHVAPRRLFVVVDPPEATGEREG